MAGDDRGDGRIAGIGSGGRGGKPAGLAIGGGPGGLSGRGARAARARDARRARGPFRFRPGGAGHAAQLVQGQVQLDLGGLPGPLRQAPGAGQPAAGFFESVMTALRGRPGVFRAGLLAQRV